MAREPHLEQKPVESVEAASGHRCPHVRVPMLDSNASPLTSGNAKADRWRTLPVETVWPVARITLRGMTNAVA
eukprot:862536-Lingulodinium_polyedra.AAC.1